MIPALVFHLIVSFTTPSGQNVVKDVGAFSGLAACVAAIPVVLESNPPPPGYVIDTMACMTIPDGKA